MKTRAELIQNCHYPTLPENSTSAYNLLYNDSNPEKISFFESDKTPTPFPSHGSNSFFWLGSRLTTDISADSFTLDSQFCKIKCFVSKSCRLFFDFNDNSKGISWTQTFSLLRAGDHVLIYIQSSFPINKVKDEFQNNAVWEFKDIKRITLVSVNKAKKQACSFALAQQQENWFGFLSEVTTGMKYIGLKAVETPTLVDCVGTEPDLNLFETRFFLPSEFHKNKSNTGRKKKLFLSSSPEMYLKRLLCQGWTDIYEIKKCFRNSEEGPVNHSEFYLLEWYRAYSGLNRVIEDLWILLHFLSIKITGASFPRLKKISMKSLFKQHLDMRLRSNSSRKDFACELQKRNIPFKKSDDIEDLFYLLFLNGIEPYLDYETPLIVYDYPPFQKSYARIGLKGWANRFELYWKGMELANAFDEVIRPEEQMFRFQEDKWKREKRGRQKLPTGDKLLNDMQSGMPPSAGVALGLDRLFLAFKGLNNLKKIRLFI